MVYDACSVTQANKLQTHQHLALKTVLNVDQRFSSSKLHTLTDIKWLDSERKERCCIEAYRALNGMSSANVNKLFVKNTSDKGLRSCDSVNFRAPVTRTKFGDGNLINRCEQYWRQVPDEIKCITKFGSFKHAPQERGLFLP